MWGTLLKYVMPGLILLVLGAGTVNGIDTSKKLSALRADVAACSLAAQKPLDSLQKCAPEVAARVGAARRAEMCEAALAQGDIYTVRAACGAQVKFAVAARDAAETNLASTRDALAQAKQQTDEAVARAEQRATNSAERNAQNARTIDAAPRTADGLVRCDADCLRHLSGQDRPAARP